MLLDNICITNSSMLLLLLCFDVDMPTSRCHRIQCRYFTYASRVRSSVSPSMQACLFCVCLRFDLNENSLSLHWGGYRRAYAACVRWVISKMALSWRGETERRRNCWKKVIFIFFVYKKISSRFIKLRLNHWWQMHYPGDAFHSFLNLDSVIYLAVDGTVTSLTVFI